MNAPGQLEMLLCQQKDDEWRQVVSTYCQRPAYRPQRSEQVAVPSDETHHVEGTSSLNAMIFMNKGFGLFPAKNTCLCPRFRNLTFRLRVPRSILDLGIDAVFRIGLSCNATSESVGLVSPQGMGRVAVVMQSRSLDRETADARLDMLIFF